MSGTPSWTCCLHNPTMNLCFINKWIEEKEMLIWRKEVFHPFLTWLLSSTWRAISPECQFLSLPAEETNRCCHCMRSQNADVQTHRRCKDTMLHLHFKDCNYRFYKRAMTLCKLWNKYWTCLHSCVRWPGDCQWLLPQDREEFSLSLLIKQDAWLTLSKNSSPVSLSSCLGAERDKAEETQIKSQISRLKVEVDLSVEAVLVNSFCCFVPCTDFQHKAGQCKHVHVDSVEIFQVSGTSGFWKHQQI